ncbi:MAG: hypothetical protein U0835_20420 [Isosphaeraceae bacterium]
MAELAASDPRLQTLDTRLADVRAGTARDVAERLALAQRAYDTKPLGLPRGLWAEAFEADPKAAADRETQHPYNACGAAAMAAAGQGATTLSRMTRRSAKPRGQALGWLRAELDAWSKLVAPTAAGEGVRRADARPLAGGYRPGQRPGS